MNILAPLLVRLGRFVGRNSWLVAAVTFEVLGLVASLGALPRWTDNTLQILAITGILSCTGVVIVTVYFMYQYNRRPLNEFQLEQLANYLQEYTPSSDLDAQLANIQECHFPASMTH